MPKDHRRAIVSRLRNQPWMITAEALTGIAELLSEYTPGESASPELIAARLGISSDRESKMVTVGDAAIIPVAGVIQPKPNAVTRWLGGVALSRLLESFDEAIGAEQVKRILFLVDSPGGSAMGNEEAAAYIRSKRGEKEILAFTDGLMGSAAYYLGSAASKVYASPSSAVGSIGTITFHQDASSFWKEWGIKWTPLFFGKHKADGNTVEPLSDQSRATIQEFVDAFGKQFANAVATNRGVPLGTVTSQFGQGKIFLAAEAAERGLIDGVAQDLDAVLAMGADAGGARATAVVVSTENETLEPGWNRADENAYAAGAATSTSQTEVDEMIKRIKAALYALGLVDSDDAEDAVCTVALKAFCHARGVKYDEDAGEATILALLSTPPASSAASSSGEGGSANVQAAHDQELEEAREEARNEAKIAERERVAKIRASAKLLSIGEKDVEAAIASDKTHAEIVEAWAEKLAEEEEGVTPITAGEAALDTFTSAACESLFDRLDDRNDKPELSQAAREMGHKPLIWVAQESLRLAGRRVDPFAAAEDTALAWLQQDAGIRVFSTWTGSANRPGDFPNLLSALAGKILDMAIEQADPTYPYWTAKIGDVPDFKPKTIIGVGKFDELDLILDDDEAQDRQLDEEFAGWIAADRYGNKVGLTPVMVANDDLDAFSEGVASLGGAHEMTLNRLCVALIAGNVTLVDGNSLYDSTNHLNEVASGSGGAPSITQMNLQREAHRSQTGIGGRGKVRTPPAIALVPSTLETEAEQLFLPFAVFNESKTAATDATLNVYRGKIRPLMEAELDGYSTTQWYTFANPRLRRTIVHCFQRGYGKGGRRTTWFEPARETRYVKLEGRFGAAVASFRGTVRNYGA